MILTKEQQAQKYAEKIAGNTCMAPVIAETWLAGYTACEQSMWLTYENALYAGIVVALQFIDN